VTSCISRYSHAQSRVSSAGEEQRRILSCYHLCTKHITVEEYYCIRGGPGSSTYGIFAGQSGIASQGQIIWWTRGQWCGFSPSSSVSTATHYLACSTLNLLYGAGTIGQIGANVPYALRLITSQQIKKRNAIVLGHLEEANR
jgi:hypothetical protein